MSLRTIFTDKLWFRLAHLLDRAGRVYKKAEEWKGIKSVLEVCRKRSDNGKETQKKIFYISSLDIDIQTLAKCVREHWEVESKAHWVLDVVYKEDECAVTDKCGAENLVILRRLVLNLARLHPKKQSIKGKLTAAGWSDEFRDELLLGVPVEKWATYAVALKNG